METMVNEKLKTLAEHETILIIQKNLHRIKGISNLINTSLRLWVEDHLSESEKDELIWSIYHTTKEIYDIAEISDPDRSDFGMWGNGD